MRLLYCCSNTGVIESQRLNQIRNDEKDVDMFVSNLKCQLHVIIVLALKICNSLFKTLQLLISQNPCAH